MHHYRFEAILICSTFSSYYRVTCILYFFGCLVSGVRFRCQVSPVKCQVSGVISLVSGVTCQFHLSEKAKARATDPPSSQVSCVTCHAPGIMCQVSGVTCRVSCVRCHMSRIMCHMSFIVFSLHMNIQNFVKYVMHVRIIAPGCYFSKFW